MQCPKCNREMTEKDTYHICYDCPPLVESQNNFLKSLPSSASITGVFGTNNIIDKPDPNIAIGIREYSEDHPVLVKPYEFSDNQKRPLVVVAINEGGFNSTHVDLLDILVWVKKYRPDLLDEADKLI